MSHKQMIEKVIRLSISSIVFPLTMYQTILSSYQLSKLKPTGKLVRIGERHLHVNVTGEHIKGNPTVILESGMGGCSLDWSLVQPELSKHTTVISYDRAGFGWSIETMEEPTCKHYVNDLRLLLQETNLKPPYILVGHSYGGLMMKLFASEFAEEVAGLVLVDSVHEDHYDTEKMDKNRRNNRKKIINSAKLGYILSPLGLPRMLKRHIGSKRLPTNIQAIITALGFRNNAYKAAYYEILCMEKSTLQLKKHGRLKSDLPVIVMSAGKQSEDWKDSQKKLLNLTDNTKQIVVEESWHSIQVYEPDSVIKAVKSFLT